MGDRAAVGVAPFVDSADEAIVTVDALSVTFGDVTALDGVSIALRGRGVTGLVGLNGAGKTTLVLTTLGLLAPTVGAVRRPLIPGAVAYCPDTPAFEPWLDAVEVLEQSRLLAGLPPQSPAASDVLATVGLSDARRRRVGGFSRGMTQRLGIAAALVLEPQLLLLDEPTSALDPLGRDELLRLVVELGRERHVLFSSHLLGDVETVADNVLILHRGRLLYDGAISELVVDDRAEITVRFDPLTHADTVAGLPDEAPSGAPLRWVADDAAPDTCHVVATSMADVFAALAPIADRVLEIGRRRTTLQSAFVARTRQEDT